MSFEVDLDNYAIEPFLWGKGFAHWMVLQFNNERKKKQAVQGHVCIKSCDQEL